jgi:hypothetical protein
MEWLIFQFGQMGSKKSPICCLHHPNLIATIGSMIGINDLEK